MTKTQQKTWKCAEGRTEVINGGYQQCTSDCYEEHPCIYYEEYQNKLDFDADQYLIMQTALRNLKLTTELVPQPLWFKSLREATGRRNWDKIRFQSYDDYGHKCGICQCHPNRLECHELWEYDDDNHIQYLRGFISLCVPCHNIKHLGLVNIRISRGELPEEYYNDLIKHFLVVNNCSEDVFNQHSDDVFAQWEIRSQYKWKQDFGEYANLIQENH